MQGCPILLDIAPPTREQVEAMKRLHDQMRNSVDYVEWKLCENTSTQNKTP